MYKLRTLNLPPYRGRDFFVTTFVEPDPRSFRFVHCVERRRTVGHEHSLPAGKPSNSQVEVARIDTEHGEPHFDRLYEQDQQKDWLGKNDTYEQARQNLLSN